MSSVFVISHHEGLIAITTTRDHAERICASHLAAWKNLYGKPWVEEVTVLTEGHDEAA